MADLNLSLSNEMLIVACGCRANEMAGELNRLIKKFGQEEVQEDAMQLIDTLTLVARVMETFPKEVMSRPMNDIPAELRDWASGKRKRAAELKEDIGHFKRAVADTGLKSN